MGGTTWPRYDSTNKKCLRIASTLQTQNAPRADHVAFWNDLWPKLQLSVKNSLPQPNSTDPAPPDSESCVSHAYLLATYIQFGILCTLVVAMLIFFIVKYRNWPSRNIARLSSPGGDDNAL